MRRRFRFRQTLVKVLTVVYDVPYKRLAAGIGVTPDRLSKQMASPEDLKPEALDRMVTVIGASPAAVKVVSGCLEGLEPLDRPGNLTSADHATVEEAVLASARIIREDLRQLLGRSRSAPVPGYPRPADLDLHRFRATLQVERLRRAPDYLRLQIVESASELQTWALCEKACEESVRQASRDVDESLSWAQLARGIAHLVQGPDGWVSRIHGYAEGHVANSFRVRGDLIPAEVTLDSAKRHWAAGTDPHQVLDPGRLLDLEASLRRDQRRFEEALSLLEQAAALSRAPGRILIKKGFTLEVLGEYEQAVETLLHASSLVENDRRLRNLLLLNLANNFCHLDRFQEAAQLVTEVKPVVTEMGDKLDLVRIRGLEGRIAAALGKPAKALPLLADARQRFAAEGMFYDVALLLLEESILLLKLGHVARAKILASELATVFASKGVHREAIAALRLFQQAVEDEQASEELARDLLRYLLRARYDQGLRFSVS